VFAGASAADLFARAAPASATTTSAVTFLLAAETLASTAATLLAAAAPPKSLQDADFAMLLPGARRLGTGKNLSAIKFR
jgi:hypothetical protein